MPTWLDGGIGAPSVVFFFVGLGRGGGIVVRRVEGGGERGGGVWFGLWGLLGVLEVELPCSSKHVRVCTYI